MTSLQQIGNLCRAYRIYKKITLRQVADALGTSNQNVSSFENGKNDSATIYQCYINLGLYDEFRPKAIIPLSFQNRWDSGINSTHK